MDDLHPVWKTATWPQAWQIAPAFLTATETTRSHNGNLIDSLLSSSADDDNCAFHQA